MLSETLMSEEGVMVENSNALYENEIHRLNKLSKRVQNVTVLPGMP